MTNSKIFIPFFLFIFLLSFAQNTYAQLEEGKFYFGLKGGYNYAKIDDVATTLIPPVFDINTYNTETLYRHGVTMGFFLYTRPKLQHVALQFDFAYTLHGFETKNNSVEEIIGDFNYSDVNGLEYKVQFNYHYVDVSPIIKAYPLGGLTSGLHVLTGPQLSINVGQTNLEYKSNKPDIGPDLQIRDSMRGVLKGRNNFSWLMGLGYEFDFGLTIEARYSLGLNDVLETQANGFGFVDNANKKTTFELRVGYAIPFSE